MLKNVDAIVTSSNEYLQGNKNNSYWRFNGRRNVDGDVRNGLNQDELDQELSGEIGENKLSIGHSIMTRSSGRILANGVKYIIHTITPDGAYGYENNNSDCMSSDNKLSNCYSSSLLLAENKKLKTCAFPALGCGVKEWIRARGAKIAFETLKQVKLQSVNHVYFVFLDNVTLNTFKLIGEKTSLLNCEEVIEDGYRYQFKS